MKHIFNLYI